MEARIDRLRTLLSAAFQPLALDVQDESAQHAGHAGHRPQGETHYTVQMVSEAFQGHSRVARHRAVNQVVAAEFADGLHALSLNLRTPDEAGLL